MNTLKFFFFRQFMWEIIRILVVGIAGLLFYSGMIPIYVLIAAMAFGLYGLAKTAVTSIVKTKKIGTELFITIAVIISVIGQEYLAGAIVLMILLIAEYIAAASGEKARASIKELIGSVPKTAIAKETTVKSLSPLKI